MKRMAEKSKYIVELTAAHRSRMAEWVERWTRIGLCTDPANRRRAKENIRACYRLCGFTEPKVVWVDSPMIVVICGPLVEQILVKHEWPMCFGQPPLGVESGVESGVRSGVWSGVRSGVGSGVWSGVESGVRSGVESGVWSGVESGVWSGVWSGVRSGVRSGVESSVRSGVESTIIGWHNFFGGQFWVAWQSYQSFVRYICGLDLGPELEAKADAYQAVTESACWWWPGTHVCYVADRPEQINVWKNAQGINVLNNGNGPSIRFRDGWALWHLRGVSVPQHVVEKPGRITLAEIDAATNAEYRRILIERFGFDRYLCDSGAKMIQQDDFGKLYRKEIDNEPPMQFVRVVNSTPDPDGTRREYVIPIRNTCRTAHQAVAESFGLSVESYNPFMES